MPNPDTGNELPRHVCARSWVAIRRCLSRPALHFQRQSFSLVFGGIDTSRDCEIP